MRFFLPALFLLGGCSGLASLGRRTPQDTRPLRAVYVAYTKDAASFRDRARIDAEAKALAAHGFNRVFLAMDANGAAALAKGGPFADLTRYFVDRLEGLGVPACAGILSDEFSGEESQVDVLAEVDALISFNRFVCLVTDYEMHGENKNAANYAKWKKVHAAIRSRLGTHATHVELFAYTNVFAELSDRYLMSREGFPVVDAVIPMYYTKHVVNIRRRVADDLRAIRAMPGGPDLMAGINVSGTDASLENKADYEKAIAFGDSLAGTGARFIGTATFLWDSAKLGLQ